MDNSHHICYLDRGVKRFVGLPSCKSGEELGEPVAVASASSPAVREYEDKLKAIELQQRGVEKATIALRLGKSERWVQRWWKQEPRLIQRPHGAQDTVFQKVPLAGFRDLEITRGFAKGPSLFETLVRNVAWRRGKVMTRDQITGELVLRFDRQGKTISAARLVADCPRGIAELDALLQRTFSKANIRDPQARVVLNLYTDGEQQLNSHRHDFWTCLISLGAPRVLLVDNRPHVMEDGDMIVFGTQMHGVPAMPAISDGRISLVIFFYPDRDNLERRWLTVCTGDAEQDDEAVEQVGDAPIVFHDDCRTGSASSSAVPGASELAALTAVLDPSAQRTRPHWRKSNAELQFMEYPKLHDVSLYSAGCGDLSAIDLLAGLTRHSVTILWDLRTGREGGLAIGREKLRETCRGRVQYREWQIGTAAAGGLARHLFCTEEGTTMIYRLLSESKGAAVCFLGYEGDWREDDLRMSVGYAAAAAGAHVIHLHLRARAEVSLSTLEEECESQPKEFQLPSSLQPLRPKNSSAFDIVSDEPDTANMHNAHHTEETILASSSTLQQSKRGALEIDVCSSNDVLHAGSTQDAHAHAAIESERSPKCDGGSSLEQIPNVSIAPPGSGNATQADVLDNAGAIEKVSANALHSQAPSFRNRRWERFSKSAGEGSVGSSLEVTSNIVICENAEDRKIRGRWNGLSRNRV